MNLSRRASFRRNLALLLATSLAAASAHAGVFVIREGAVNPLLGQYTGSIDNSINGHVPATVMDPDVSSINVGNFYAQPRGAMFKFPLTDSVLPLIADSITSADFTVYTTPTSSTADQDMLVRAAALTSGNASWSENQVTWNYRNNAAFIPWTGGFNGPTTAGVDYRTPAFDRVVRAAEMNTESAPIRFGLQASHVRDWIKTPSSNGGVFYWSSTTNNSGSPDDNFQVHSSESGTASRRPTLTIRYKSPFTRSLFDQQDLTINNGNGYKNYENDSGALTWGEAYVMRSYMQLYRSTRDTYYLDKLVNHADAVLLKRDDVNPNTLNSPGWSMGARGYESAAVASGHIVWPMVEFARVVKSDPALAAYNAKADTYIAKSVETVNWLNSEFKYDLSGGRSSYRVQPNGAIYLDAPNADATAGMVLEQLYAATGSTTYRDLADRIARTILNPGFFQTELGNWAWSYGYDGVTDPEDISHGGIVAPFIARMAKQNRVFTPALGQSLVNTLRFEGFQGAGQMYPGIEGSTSPTARIGTDPFNWAVGMAGGLADLAQFDLRLLPLAEAVQLRVYGASAHQLGWPLHAIASMVRYNQIPQEMTVTATVIKNGATYRCEIPAYATLTGPTELTLVNDQNPGDVQRILLDLGGTGDDWAQTWQLSLNVNAGSAVALQGGTLRLTVSGLGGYQDPKTLTGAVLPGGYSLITSAPNGQLTAIGTLNANSTFLINANEISKNESYWALDANGSFNEPVNFAGDLPNSAGAMVNFLSVNSTPRMITNGTLTTLGTMRFASTNSYTIDGAGTLNLSATTGALIAVSQGGHTISAPIQLSSSCDIDISTGALLNLPSQLYANGSQTLKKLGDGTLTMRNVKVSDLQINAGLVRINPRPTPSEPAGTSRVNALAIAGTGALDLTTNAMVIDYTGSTPLASVRDLILSSAIRSSSTDNSITAIGFAEASDLYSSFPTTFAGENIDSTSILLRYTLAADANLDAQVNSTDFNILVAHFGESSARWSFADFDGNGKVDTIDFNRLAGLFGATLPNGSPELGAIVPEPSSLAWIIGGSSICLLRRTSSRRRLTVHQFHRNGHVDV